MKLVELKPKWVTLHGWSSPSAFYIGLTFQCPHCLTTRLGVLFDKPIDPDGVEQTFLVPYQVPIGTNMPQWARQGDTFETLTLAPSIDAAFIAGHWHGFIQNGEIQ